jgi:regulator of sirC expression with transglutaminase-like and TPR domain
MLANDTGLWLNSLDMGEEFSGQTGRQALYKTFKAQVEGEDDAIDLAYSALLVAKFVYPELEIAAYKARLDALAQRVHDVLLTKEDVEDEERSALKTIYAINHVLFDEEGFHGNAGDYYNADNSFLNRVLDERVGLPITLSLLYMEVARRVDLPIYGVGLPYHFVVCCPLPDKKIYIDPFERGMLMSEKVCRERIRNLSNGRVRLPRQVFEPISKRSLLVRLLSNLKHVYLNAEDYDHTLIVCDLILILMPDLAKEYRDRGIIHYQLQHYGRAIRDMKRYVDLDPDAKDRYEILNHIKMIRETIARLN